MFGVITSAFYAEIDNTFSHEHEFGNCPGFPNILGAIAPDCPSDYEFKVRPIGPQPGAFPRPSLFGKENRDLVKVEYELYYASAAHAFFDPPREAI